MGAILDARQRAIDRTVAMKVMLATDDEASVLRFIDEAKITGQLDHPNIVPIHDLGVDEQGQVFYTMKFVRGVTLKEVIDRLAEGDAATAKKYPLPALLTIFQKVCDALAFAHSRGVIHRDLKPANIMLGDFGSVLVMDWGLAKVLGPDETSTVMVLPPAARVAPSGVIRSTRTVEADLGGTMDGAIMGTLQYMPPEQARGETARLDARADIYALGAIFFEILHLRRKLPEANQMSALLEGAVRGEVAWAGPDPRSRIREAKIPESLLSICRKALAAEASARYAAVADLQADVAAYQNGFATRAEKAGAWKQLTLLVKRHKAASLGLAAVLLVGSTLGTKAIIEGRKAQREAQRANNALAELKKTAPALRQLADTEAGFQRFESALQKLDAASALDPDDLPSRWRRAWLLLGMENYAGAAAAIREAQAKDPTNKPGPAILPIIEQLAAAPDGDRWTPERAQAIYAHLQKVRAPGEVSALSAKMKLGSEEKVKLIRARLDDWLGKDKGRIVVTEAGWIEVLDFGRTVQSVEPLHGLPINGLNIGGTAVTDLESLRGMPLLWIDIGYTRITNLEPLRGMALRGFEAPDTGINDWSPLRGAPLVWVKLRGVSMPDISFLAGAPLEHLDTGNAGISDLSALRGAPLKHVCIFGSAVTSLEPLADSPLEELHILRNPVSDLSPLRGKPLKYLNIEGTKVSNLAPLAGTSIIELLLSECPITDFRPLLDLPKLEKLNVGSSMRGLEVLRHHPSLRYIALDGDKNPYQPVAEFWPNYDARVAAEIKAAREKLDRLLATNGRTAPDGTIELDCNKLNLADLSALKGLKISQLSAEDNPITDLSPLTGMALRKLSLNRTQVSGLQPLRGMPLSDLRLYRTAVTDLSPLRGMPLEELYFDGTPVKDFRPLLDLP